MRRLIASLMGLFLLLPMVGCSQGEEETGLLLYYPVADTALYGDAMGSQSSGLEGEVDILQLMDALLSGPTDTELQNPFPAGTQILWAGWQSDGVLVINLTEEYGGLMGIDLTLADYSIVTTLCQLDYVTQVQIWAANQENPFRDHQTLSMDDILQES